MRKKIVAGNWKMNLDLREGITLFSEISDRVPQPRDGAPLPVICAPFIHLTSLVNASDGKVRLGAQNCHQKASGAYTGEISAGMLRSAGCEFVIIGHSERRQYFAESDEVILEKTRLVLHNGLIPVFCVGETLDERNNGNYYNVLKGQLANAVFALNEDEFSNLVIAYEPVWAIGTGLTASPDQAQDIHRFIRTEIENRYGFNTADDTSILYGGSCNAANAAELFAQADIDGGLIGGASLKADDFVAILNSFPA